MVVIVAFGAAIAPDADASVGAGEFTAIGTAIAAAAIFTATQAATTGTAEEDGAAELEFI